jgi:phage-related tail protein
MRELMTLSIILVLAFAFAMPTKGSRVSTKITDLRRKVENLESRVGRQVDALNNALQRTERVERELRARIRELEERLKRQSR